MGREEVLFAAAAEAMRRILVDNARAKGRQRRGGDWVRVDFDATQPQSSQRPVDILLLDDALGQLAAARSAESGTGQASLLRWHDDRRRRSGAGRVHGNSRSQLCYARAWLADKMDGMDDEMGD